MIGDVGLLQQRLAMIRTWTYASFRPDWLENPVYWRERTRAIEDRLSDALHEALTQRFVDRRTTALIAGLKREDVLTTQVSETGAVSIEGHQVGHLSGLRFLPDTHASTLEGKTLRSAALKALEPVIAERLKVIAGAPQTAISLNPAAQLVWQEAPVAQLVAGPHWLVPVARLMGGDGAEAHQLEAATARLNEWLGTEIQTRLPTHFKIKFSPDEGLEGLARGLAYRLLESGAASDLRGEDRRLQPGPEARLKLKEMGIRTGRIAAHIPDAQKPASQRLMAILQQLADGRARKIAPEGAGSFPLEEDWRDDDLAAQGYLRFGKRAVRADLAERLGWELSKRRKEADKPVFDIPPELASLVSCPLDDFHTMLKGYNIAPAEKDPETGEVRLWRFQSKAVLEQQKERRQQRRQKQGGDRAKASRTVRDKPNKDGSARAKATWSGKGLGKSRPNPAKSNRPRPGAALRQPDPDSPFAALRVLLPDPPEATARPKKKKPKKKNPKGPDMQQAASSQNPGSVTPAADSASGSAKQTPDD